MQQEWKGLNYCLRNLKLPWSSLLFLILIYYNLASEVWELLSLSTSQITRLTQKESGELSSGKRTLIAILLWYPGHFANRFSLRWKRKTKPGLKTLWEHWIWFSSPHALTQSCLPLFPPEVNCTLDSNIHDNRVRAGVLFTCIYWSSTK